MVGKSKKSDEKGLVHFFKWFLFDKEESWKTKMLHWVALVLLLFEALTCFLAVFDTTLKKDQQYTVTVVWTGYLEYFTYQSNLILLVVIILFFSNFGRKERWMHWKTNLPIICAATYITITFVVYASYLYKPDHLFEIHYIDETTGRIEYLWYIRTILDHYICPLLMIFFFIWSCFCPRYYGPNLKRIPYWKALIIGYIYPILYLLYLIFASYVLDTKYNPYGIIADFKNHPFYAGMFTLGAFVAFGGILFLYTFLSNRFITNPNKQKYDSKSVSRP